MTRKLLLILVAIAITDYLYNFIYAWRTYYEIKCDLFFYPEEGRFDVQMITKNFRGTIYSLRSLSEKDDKEAPLIITNWKYNLSGKGKVWRFPFLGTYNVLLNPGRDVKFTYSLKINTDHYSLEKITKYQVFPFRMGDLFLFPPRGWKGKFRVQVHLPPKWTFITPFEREGKEYYWTEAFLQRRGAFETHLILGLFKRIEVLEDTEPVNFFLSSLWSTDFNRHLIRRTTMVAKELKRFLPEIKRKYPCTIVYYPEIRERERMPYIDSTWIAAGVPAGVSLSTVEIGILLSSSLFMNQANRLSHRGSKIPYPLDKLREDNKWFLSGMKHYCGFASGCEGESEKVEAEMWKLYLDYLNLRREVGEPPLLHNHDGIDGEPYTLKSLLVVYILDRFIRRETKGEKGMKDLILFIMERYGGGKRPFSLKEALYGFLNNRKIVRFYESLITDNNPIPPFFPSFIGKTDTETGSSASALDRDEAILDRELSSLSVKRDDPFYSLYITGSTAHLEHSVRNLLISVKEEALKKGMRFCPFEGRERFFENYVNFKLGRGG